MERDRTKTIIAALAFCLAVGAVYFVALTGCGGEAKPTSDEVDARYLQVAKRARKFTFRIERATEDPPDRSVQIAREFRSFAGRVEQTATFILLMPSDLGPVGDKGFAFLHSLDTYESVLRAVAKHARGGGRSLNQAFRGARQAGADVRRVGTAFESALKADIAD